MAFKKAFQSTDIKPQTNEEKHMIVILLVVLWNSRGMAAAIHVNIFWPL